MRNDIFNTLSRTNSFVGFDELFEKISSDLFTKSTFPPHDIEQHGETTFKIIMAVAGFKREDIKITIKNNNHLLIEGNQVGTDVARADAGIKIIHSGLAKRSFTKTFMLAEHAEVVSADVQDGLLSITIEKNIPKDNIKIIDIK